jgi:hypothetical protein
MVDIAPEPVYYNVQFLKDIKDVKKGTIKQVMILPMVGRIFQPGRDLLTGHFIDTVGERDGRWMVMGVYDPLNGVMDEFYWVAADKAEVVESLNEVPWPLVKTA